MTSTESNEPPCSPSVRVTEGEELRIAGLGDSLTYGWMVRRGFFDRFCDALEARHREATIVRFNEGVPGDTARGGLRRLPSLLEHRPHLVLVQFGLNDLFCGIDGSSFAATIEQMAEAILAARAEPWLLTSCPLALPGHAAAARPLYDAIRAVGEKRGVAVADLDRFWRDRHEPATPAGSLFLDDGVHPDDSGHEVMAQGLLALWVSPPTSMGSISTEITEIQ